MDKEFTTKTGSKSNLNESNIPLLEEEGKGETPEKEEKIEMETKLSNDEKGDEKKDDAAEDKKDKKKKPKEKKPKEKKEGPKKTPMTCAQTCTIGLNVLDRDEKSINNHVNLYFEDILAEPDSNHGFEFFWRLSFLLFTSVRQWVYCILTAILSLPLALLWGAIFALVNVFTVWLLTPVSKIFDIAIYHLHKYWNGLIRCFLDPLFNSVGLIFSNIRTKSDAHAVISP